MLCSSMRAPCRVNNLMMRLMILTVKVQLLDTWGREIRSVEGVQQTWATRVRSGVEILRRTEKLEMDAILRDVQRAKAEGQHAHETLGATEVESRLRHHHGPLQPVHGYPPRYIVVLALHVLGRREFVEDERADCVVRGDHVPDMLFHRLLPAREGRMDIPRRPLAAPIHERIQHAKQGRKPDPAAQENDWPLILFVQDEIAGWRADAQDCARLHLIVQVI